MDSRELHDLRGVEFHVCTELVPEEERVSGTMNPIPTNLVLRNRCTLVIIWQRNNFAHI
jgi:hypothetical protein